VPVVDADQRQKVESMAELIMSEVNVKEIKIVDNEESGLVKRVKADFKKLGPRYGKIMKQLGKAIQEMDQKQISELERNGQYTFAELPESPVVTTEDVEIIPEDVPGWLVANDGNITVALDVTVTDELRNEGMGRELVNRIQNIRKSSGFEITDKINILVESNENTNDAINYHKEYIASQVLAANIKIEERVANATELDFEEFKVNVNIEKA
jgi:isoleucyl-tRNA synthetase